MEALKAVGICHSYGCGVAKREVLKDMSFAMQSGEFTALMGPSGSGKSTFLHLAAGLLAPDAGEISVGGTVVTSLGDGAAAKFRRRHEGVVFQSFNLVETLTVADNIVLPAKLDRIHPDTERLSELIGRLGLSGLEKRLPGGLSGGERQRVAFARALFRKPDIVLADEPTGNLDEASAKSICELLGELNRTEGTAILLVTHDPRVAAAASRVCFLKNGAVSAGYDTGHDPTTVSRHYLEIYG